MTLPVGNIEYNIGQAPVIGCGLSWTQEHLDSALNGQVKDLVKDTEGKESIKKLLSGVTDTEFASEELENILDQSITPEPWRVGEAISEAYLSAHRSCTFPWPDSRDERKSGSSLPGADLVGFCEDQGCTRFAFGEVKTSAEKNYPPNAVHGRNGLQKQIEDLRSSEKIRNDLFKYLAHRAENASWKTLFINASKQFLADKANIKIFGLLVRDVVPNEEDLKNRVSNLYTDCPSTMSIELIAIYLPANSIQSLPINISNKQGGVI